MTQIYPAEGQLIGELTNQLTALGLKDGTDFWLHYAWNAKPYIQTTVDAYDTWATSELGDPAEPEVEPETPDPAPEDPAQPDEPPSDEDTPAAKSTKTASKRGGK